MMDYDGPEASNEIQNSFGTLNKDQLWILWKLCRHSAGRCRNTTAQVNYFNRLFGKIARFRSVTETRTSVSDPMETYQAKHTEITMLETPNATN